ncbi:28 kDa ribonucleoprotein, chloroplastic-like [Silene latifolia]|uniref:28 kDa ribonucleoprotein, chloroplastic-like n=1 Tax=Silene latifolia TaxID=37657 RepID=UPI003D7884D1
MEAMASIRFSHLHTALPLSSLSIIPKLAHYFIHSSPSSIHLHISNSTPLFPLKSRLYPSNFSSFRPTFELHSSAEGVAVLETPPDKTQDKSQKRKLFVFNFPWSYTPDDLRKVFSECGTVKDAEIIKNKDGKYRGFAFITMSSGEEAQAVVDKFNSKELAGRTITVEFARKLRKPRPQSTVDLPVKETRHKLYVSNLQWKARSSHLREFFSADFNPVSARVVFENPNGRSAGYGFVSFNTREEAEAAIASLNGKELLGRPVTLKFSERTTEVEAANEDEEEKEKQDDSVSPVVEEEVSEAENTS